MRGDTSQRWLRPHTIGGAWTDADQILLCTDGFARLVSDYDLLPHRRQVITDGGDYGLAYMEKLIRDFERRPAGDSHARFKRSGDVATVLLSSEAS